MTSDLQKEIENHLASFPERYKEVEEMKREWKDFRTRSTWILVGFITSMLAIGVWVGTMQTHIESVTTQDSDDKQRFTQIESRINTLEVNNGEIRSRLASIEMTLQEIKTAIIRLQ